VLGSVSPFYRYGDVFDSGSCLTADRKTKQIARFVNGNLLMRVSCIAYMFFFNGSGLIEKPAYDRLFMYPGGFSIICIDIFTSMFKSISLVK
jgi:hypothetical protein